MKYKKNLLNTRAIHTLFFKEKLTLAFFLVPIFLERSTGT